MPEYSFDADLAAEYGVPEAIFVHHLYWWVRKNSANNCNLKDGRYWTYNSVAALTEYFPFWSRRQIEGVINRCREKGLTLTATHSDDRRDRTTWYTITDVVFHAYRSAEKKPPKEDKICDQMGKCNTPKTDASSPKWGNVYKEQLVNQLVNEGERTREEQQEAKCAAKKSKPEEPKKTYGEFANVHLTDTELGKLLSRWTCEQVQHEIEALSAYMKSKGKTYKDHYATLLGWIKRDFPAGQAAVGGRVLIDDD